MSYINTYEKKNSNILRLLVERNSINLSPSYQRNGEIWPLEKRQLLIDSILNDYDIPKIYFHTLSIEEKKSSKFEYAVIDGRQRIETIFKFIDGEFSLSEDFVYLKNTRLKVKGLSYKEIAKKHPILKMSFDSFNLPIICVETDDYDLIDDMFLRLNEAVPLNAAEKRNAIGGPLVKSIKQIAKHPFFKENTRISNKRFQHLEISVRLLFIEHYLTYKNKIYDTKKVFLDELVKNYKKKNIPKASKIEKSVSNILDLLHQKFNKKDPLLNSQSILPIYYLTARKAKENKTVRKFTRKKLDIFKTEISKNKAIAEIDISKAIYDYIEFDRMSLQGTNDSSSIKERTRILSEYLEI